ncbi:phosphatase PAP2 family protein [Rhodococcus sp. ARC_M12]|uniref:phosphatase PAP2 family protein n=1 Tax=unclassified Rhodococcus (in: high G+C Gram-positive bacteria) TaxID=192944 RepID=UPI001FB1D385|nr:MULTISPECIES: phosphatase PAP2 family protein [unclassified Rhodococcus (in: high G+C Gram-positive bacteria)]MCJ0893188.1 phosphatase PAP2 family protein [Rhodococcus sp. ARC_M5]MCJ0976543.1 phosphatase PAP2 family protein [Rhodococcus sp. ARC_M12]
MTRVEPRRLVASLALLNLGVLVYCLCVMTTTGQTVDQKLMVSAESLSGDLVEICAEFVDLVAPVSAAGTVLVACLIMFSGNRIALSLRVGIMTLGPIATAWILKYSLERPNLDGLVQHNSFPSGTLTCVTAVVCAVYLATARRWRIVVAINGALLVLGTAVSVVVLKWHRPSDALGALLLVGCYALAVSAFPIRISDPRHSTLADPDNERLAQV